MVRRAAFSGLWIAAGTLLAAGIGMMIWYAPTDPAQGPIQKIFYLHLGAAIGTLVAAGALLAGSAAYLWQRDLRWDALAEASAGAAVLLLFVVLMTGMVWAKQIWGHWWEWNPPLTFSLILWLLYVGYMLNRRMHSSPPRRAAVCAAFGLVASLNVPLVYLSVQFLPTSHMSLGERAPEMNQTLLVWAAGFAALTACLIWTRYLVAVRLPGAGLAAAGELALGSSATPAGGRA